MSTFPFTARRAATLTAAIVTMGLAHGDAADGTRRRVHVSFNVLATEGGRPTHRIGGIGSGPLAAGEDLPRLYLTVSPSHAEGACSTEVVASVGPPEISPAVVAWATEARVREASLGAATIDIRWTRLGPTAPDATTDGSWQPITLETTGQRVLLDYVARPSSDECLRNLALEFEVAHAGDAGEENRVIDYEVWLLHGDGRAGANLPPFRSSVRQGTATAFRFPAVRLEPPSGGSQDAGVDAVVEGEVRGWVRHDGGIDLVLSARRRLTLVGGGGGLFAEAGRKAASVASGEAVKFTLPNVTPPAGADPPLVGRALEGHAFSLVLVARQKG